jgi:hypothetical protein
MADLRPSTLLALARRGVLFELRLYRNLFRWVTRRSDTGGADVEPFTYARTVTPVMWLWIFASAVEIPLIHVLVPWETVRIVGLALGVWGLVWMVGLLAGLWVYPHLLGASALRVRHGASVDIVVPWDAVSSIERRQADLPSSVRTLQPAETEAGTDLRVGVSGQVNVHAVLRRPTPVATPQGERLISALSFFADDPRDLVGRARELSGGGRARQGRR